MNLSNRGPLGLRSPKPKPDPAYLARVRELPCCACGKYGPSEAHHCRDLPDYEERGLYSQLPGAARRSGDRDTIPLCQNDHWMFHNRRDEFHAEYGKDYGYIPTTRAALSDMEIDF